MGGGVETVLWELVLLRCKPFMGLYLKTISLGFEMALGTNLTPSGLLTGFV